MGAGRGAPSHERAPPARLLGGAGARRPSRGSMRGRARSAASTGTKSGWTPPPCPRSGGRTNGRSGARSTPSLLRKAASALPGEHDFRAFAVKGEPKPHFLCTLRRAEWRERDEGRGYTFHVAADRFLHHMVRMLVGTMVDIGLGRRPVEDMTTLLGRQDNADTSPPAPPEGLYFVSAEYPAEAFADHPGDAA